MMFQLASVGSEKIEVEAFASPLSINKYHIIISVVFDEWRDHSIV